MTDSTAAIISRILDGKSIDWEACRRAGLSETELRALQVLDDVRLGGDEPEDALEPIPLLERWGFQIRSILAEHRSGEQTVALTVFTVDPRGVEDTVARILRREAVESSQDFSELAEDYRKFASLRHPHLLRLASVEQHQGVILITWPRNSGRTLKEMQSDDEEVGVLERVKLGIQICAALGQLHALEISHGALTASNVLQDAEGRAVLLDFGRRSFNTAARRDPQRDLADLAHLLLSMGSVPESLSTLLQSVKQGPAKQVSSAVALGLRLRQWLNDQSMARSRWSFKNWIRRR